MSKMFGFVKKMFIAAMAFVGCGTLISSNPLKCVSMSNQECKVRPAMVNINSNEPLFYPYSLLVNKCSDSCNDINNQYARLCVPGVAKNMNIKIFNLLSKTNETRYMSWHETCACKCRLDVNVRVNVRVDVDVRVNVDVDVDASVCNNRQRSNNDKCRYECK